MVEEYKIRPAEIADVDNISGFRTRLFAYNPDELSREPEYYRWKYFENPYQHAELWLAENDGQIVGMIGMTPKKLLVNGQILDAAEIGDTFTHPDYQRQGIFLRLLQRSDQSARDHGIEFIYGFPNQQALPGYIKRYDYILAPFDLINMLKILDAGKLTKIPLAGPVINTVSNLFWNRKLENKPTLDITIHSAKDFPEEIDSFGEKVAKDCGLAVVRNYEYLSWRYVTNPDNYLIYIAKRADIPGEEIVGFIVVKQMSHRQHPIYKIADYLTLKDDGSVFIALVSQLIEEAKKSGIIAISTGCVKDNFYYQLLRKTGFLSRNPITMICNSNEKIDDINPEGNIHLTLGDSDNI